MRELARHLRRNATEAEKILWERLRGRHLQGLKFHRQDPVGPFITDFCCRERRLIVELDGEVHDSAQETARDAERDRFLQGNNYIVLRFPNQRVLEDPDSVLRDIAIAAWKIPPPWIRLKR
ncbi:MAG TPA: endonuclease domain-containing protein [Thermoanaerobaculia bacterium]|nr:endonuclease domain-containing protein [Thermoanaerobaculia bacterium]